MHRGRGSTFVFDNDRGGYVDGVNKHSSRGRDTGLRGGMSSFNESQSNRNRHSAPSDYAFSTRGNRVVPPPPSYHQRYEAPSLNDFNGFDSFYSVEDGNVKNSKHSSVQNLNSDYNNTECDGSQKNASSKRRRGYGLSSNLSISRRSLNNFNNNDLNGSATPQNRSPSPSNFIRSSSGQSSRSKSPEIGENEPIATKQPDLPSCSYLTKPYFYTKLAEHQSEEKPPETLLSEYLDDDTPVDCPSLNASPIATEKVEQHFAIGHSSDVDSVKTTETPSVSSKIDRASKRTTKTRRIIVGSKSSARVLKKSVSSDASATKSESLLSTISSIPDLKVLNQLAIPNIKFPNALVEGSDNSSLSAFPLNPQNVLQKHIDEILENQQQIATAIENVNVCLTELSNKKEMLQQWHQQYENLIKMYRDLHVPGKK